VNNQKLSPGYPLAVTLVMTAITVLPVAATVSFWQRSNRFLQTGADPFRVGVQVERFRPLAAAVPPGSVLGYVTDLPRSTQAGASAFRTAQYALAPRLLVDVQGKQSWDLAVGNFSRPQDYTAAGKPYGLLVVQDFGNGAVLFKRAAR